MIKLEDLTVLKRSPDLLNNVKIGQDQLYRRDFPPKLYVSILVFVFLSLQFNFVKYVIVACELPNDNSLDQWMLLKN